MEKYGKLIPVKMVAKIIPQQLEEFIWKSGQKYC